MSSLFSSSLHHLNSALLVITERIHRAFIPLKRNEIVALFCRSAMFFQRGWFGGGKPFGDCKIAKIVR